LRCTPSTASAAPRRCLVSSPLLRSCFTTSSPNLLSSSRPDATAASALLRVLRQLGGGLVRGGSRSRRLAAGDLRGGRTTAHGGADLLQAGGTREVRGGLLDLQHPALHRVLG